MRETFGFSLAPLLARSPQIEALLKTLSMIVIACKKFAKDCQSAAGILQSLSDWQRPRTPLETGPSDLASLPFAFSS